MKKENLLILIFILTIVACSKRSETGQALQSKKELDTSFLELGTVGETNTQNEVRTDKKIHLLREDQNIKFLNDQGEVEISNFDYNELSDNDIIIGNEKDRYLLKYEEDKNNSADINPIVSPASLDELSGFEDSKIKVDLTPSLDLEAPEGKHFKKKQIEVTKNTENEASDQSEKNQYNILNFENYELININANGQLLNSNIKLSRDTRLELTKGKDLKVTIKKGRLELIPTFRGDYEFNSSRLNLSTSFNALIKYEFDIHIETDSPIEGAIYFPLFKKVKIPVRLPGAIPVYIDVEIDFPAGIRLEVNNKGVLRFKVKSEYALSAKVSYDTVNGKEVSSFYDYVINDRKIEKAQSDQNYSFELFFEPRIQTTMYRVLGPYAFLNTSLQAQLNFPLEQGEDDIFVNFSGGVGVTFNEPLFSTNLLDIKSPNLFKLTKAWDIIGPKGKTKPKSINTEDEVEMNIDTLDERNRVAINLRPKNFPLLGSVLVSKGPEFGKLVYGENYQSTGLVYYYPPKVIEGRDSFQIQLIDRGVKTSPSRIVINLSQKAKDQLEKGPLKVIPEYGRKTLESLSASIPSRIENIVDSQISEGRTRIASESQIQKNMEVHNIGRLKMRSPWQLPGADRCISTLYFYIGFDINKSSLLVSRVTDESGASLPQNYINLKKLNDRIYSKFLASVSQRQSVFGFMEDLSYIIHTSSFHHSGLLQPNYLYKSNGFSLGIIPFIPGHHQAIPKSPSDMIRDFKNYLSLIQERESSEATCQR